MLGQYVDVIVSRTQQHERLAAFAEHCGCNVINGLSDVAHPCQALADLYTVREHFRGLRDATVAWVGDGNNVARSLAIGCAKDGDPVRGCNAYRLSIGDGLPGTDSP